MRIAVMSCWKYRDAWKPFFELFRKFWPDCPYPVTLVTDGFQGAFDGEYFCVDGTWCEMLTAFAVRGYDDVLVMQEDFFLNEYVNQSMIERAIEQMHVRKAGMVRLYPSPGANLEYGDPSFGIVAKGTPYRINCQVSIFRADYLASIARECNDHGEAGDFEIGGTKFAESLPDEVLAFKRDSGPWPVIYLSSAITRGLWNPDAKRLCDHHGIEADFSQRAFC